MLAIVEYPLTERVLASGKTEAQAWPPRVVELAEALSAAGVQSPTVVEVVRELPDNGYGRAVWFRPVVRVLGGYSRGPRNWAEC